MLVRLRQVLGTVWAVSRSGVACVQRPINYGWRAEPGYRFAHPGYAYCITVRHATVKLPWRHMANAMWRVTTIEALRGGHFRRPQVALTSTSTLAFAMDQRARHSQ